MSKIGKILPYVVYGCPLIMIDHISEPLFDEEDSVCIGSMVFAGVIGSLAFVALMSSVIVSLLCLKLRRIKDNEATVDDQMTSKDLIGGYTQYVV